MQVAFFERPESSLIRRYRESDLEPLLDAWYSASKVAHSFLDESFFETERENIISKYLPSAETWVYERGENVVGFIALVGNEVGGLFVQPHCQREGIGGELIDHALHLRQSLTLNVFEENVVGRRFYVKHGFVKVGEVMHEQTHKNQIRMERRRG